MQTALLSRRRFVAAAAMALAAAPAWALAADRKGGKGLVGSNIYGWTQYAQRDKKPLNLEEVISALRDSGYDYLENFMNLDRPEENARFAEQLRARGMRPVSLYTGGRMHEAATADKTVEKILAAAEVCSKAGFEVISCNPDPIGREKTDQELQTQVAALEKLGKGLRKLGMAVGVHHHLPEMANGAREFHYVFKNTSPRLVGFCYDVHWVWKGGIPAMEALKLYGKRVVTWHIRQSREGVWHETLDSGDIDYAAVAAYARSHNLPKRFTVELALEAGTKVTRSVVENHRLSREWIRRVFEV